MSALDTGGSAFPIPLDHRPGAYPAEPGMTLRDYFAAKALAGFLASPEQDYAPLIEAKVSMLAAEAYRLADAMLKERTK